MGVEHPLHHRQPEPEPARCALQVVATAVEALGDVGEIGGRDPRALVGDRHQDPVRVARLRPDVHRGALGRVLVDVGQQVVQHVGERRDIDTDLELRWDVEVHRVGRGDVGEPVHAVGDQLPKRHRGLLQAELPVLQRRGVQQRAQHRLQPVGVGLDPVQQIRAPHGRELVPARRQGLAEPLYDGERGAELVGDGRDEVVDLPVELDQLGDGVPVRGEGLCPGDGPTELVHQRDHRGVDVGAHRAVEADGGDHPDDLVAVADRYGHDRAVGTLRTRPIGRRGAHR